MDLTRILSVILACLSYALFAQVNNCRCPQAPRLLEIHQTFISEERYDSSDSLSKLLTSSKNKSCVYLKSYFRSDVFHRKGAYDSSLTELHQVGIFRETQPCFDSLKAMCAFLSAKNYHLLNQKDSAIKYQLLCSEICEKNGYLELLSKSYANLGIMLGDIEQPDRAIYYQKKSVDVMEQLKDTSSLARFNILIAGSYGYMHDVTGKKIYLDSVLYYLAIGMPLAKQTENRRALIHGYDLYAGYHTTVGNYEKALLYCDSAMMYLKRNADVVTLIRIFIKRSSALNDMNKPQESVLYADSALTLAQEFGQVDLIIAALEFQIDANVKLRRFEQAYNAQTELNHLNDSLVSLEKMNVMNELEQKYNKARNEEAILRLTHEAELKSLRINILILGIVVLIVLLAALIVFFRQRTLKNKQVILEAEQRLNRARMNPHFFFNVLTSLQTYSMKQDNANMVPIYLAKYARIMRQTLESTYNELVPLIEEIEFIRGYMDMQQLMHPQKFTYEIVTDGLEHEGLMMPSMIIQPFLENSVEHGFRNINYIGEIRIVFSADNNNLSVTTTDNGTVTGSSKNHEGYPSRAAQIITDRLFLLDNKTGRTSSFELGPNANDKGYSVNIILPLIKE
jgi:tetratricopeptide (TPR) repeat protein